MIMKSPRREVSDHVRSMLMEEVVYVCPIGISEKCQKFESLDRPFSDHHVDNNPSNSEYWNLIRICRPCHEAHNKRITDGDLNRKIRLRKRNLAIQYLGPTAVDALKFAYEFGGTVSTPSSVLRLLERGYLVVSIQNVMSVGKPYHVSFQEYEITSKGKELVEKLIGQMRISKHEFSL